MELRESGEDYLEAILMLSRKGGVVHAVDISEQLKVTKASVSKALSNLEHRGYVTVVSRDVRLTDAGLRIAEQILERHYFFRDLLISAGVDPEVAAEEGCHMEHTLSEDSFSRLKELVGDKVSVTGTDEAGIATPSQELIRSERAEREQG